MASLDFRPPARSDSPNPGNAMASTIGLTRSAFEVFRPRRLASLTFADEVSWLIGAPPRRIVRLQPFREAGLFYSSRMFERRAFAAEVFP
jgi:hypothetical protein